jgi:anti-anti-sigma factor
MSSRPSSLTRVRDPVAYGDEDAIVITSGPLRATARVERDMHQACVELVGELDLAGAMVVELVLRRVERADLPNLLVDLSGLHFIDVSGLRVVLEADRRARRKGQRLVLLRPPPEPFQVFRLTGADEQLTFLD